MVGISNGTRCMTMTGQSCGASSSESLRNPEVIPTTEIFKRLANAAELNLKASERLFEALHYRETVSCSGNSECKPMLTDNSIYSLIEDVCRNISASTACIDTLTEKTNAEYPGISVLR